MSASILASIKEISADGRYSEALLRIEEAEDAGHLDEVEATLQSAVQLDETYTDAFIELGWFRFNVQNDPKGALESFQAALKLLVSANTEAISGALKSIRELEPDTDLDRSKAAAILRLVDEARLANSLGE
jgi:hypothetical protein